jgi:hypothetical protein
VLYQSLMRISRKVARSYRSNISVPPGVYDVTRLFQRLTEVEGKPVPRYTRLIIHDLRRSAIKNLMKAGVPDKVAMSISGHKTRAVFDRCHIVDTGDVVEQCGVYS